MRVNDCIIDWLSVESRVCQGCVLSPMLFVVLIDYLMKKWIEAKVEGVKFKD